MFWWIVLAVVVTFGASVLFRMARISTVVGGLLAIPSTWLLFGFKENEATKAVTGAFGDLFAAFVSYCAGVLLGSLILCHHTPLGYYWILCAPVVGIMLMIRFARGAHPILGGAGSLEAWPNLIGSLGAIVACYCVAGPWFR